MNKFKLTLLFGALFTYAATAVAEESSLDNPQVVPGGQLIPVTLSNRSPNDVLCRGGKAIDYWVSQGLPIEITKIPDSSGWMISMLSEVSNKGNRRYFFESFEAYFICSTGTFKTTINPKLEKSKTVWLGTGVENTIKENLELIKSKDIETFAADLATQIINDNGNGDMLPNSYSVKLPPKSIRNWHENIISGALIRPVREIKVDGTGITAIEYEVMATRTINLTHKMFLKTPLGANIFVVSLENEALKKGQKSSVVITHLDRGF